MSLLTIPPKCWDYRCALPCLARKFDFIWRKGREYLWTMRKQFVSSSSKVSLILKLVRLQVANHRTQYEFREKK
jgi:hypothetical protein